MCNIFYVFFLFVQNILFFLFKTKCSLSILNWKLLYNNIALINLDTLDDFFGFEKKDRNLEIYLKDPKNIQDQKQIVQTCLH